MNRCRVSDVFGTRLSQVVRYYDAIDTKADEESDGRMDYKYLLSDLGIGEFVSSCHTGPQDFLRDFGPEDFAEVQQDTTASVRHGFSARGGAGPEHGPFVQPTVGSLCISRVAHISQRVAKRTLLDAPRLIFRVTKQTI